jgi:hypothetical protein
MKLKLTTTGKSLMTVAKKYKQQALEIGKYQDIRSLEEVERKCGGHLFDSNSDRFF